MGKKDQLTELLAIAQDFGWCVAMPDGDEYDMEDIVDILVVGSLDEIQELNPWNGEYILYGPPQHDEVH